MDTPQSKETAKVPVKPAAAPKAPAPKVKPLFNDIAKSQPAMSKKNDLFAVSDTVLLKSKKHGTIPGHVRKALVDMVLNGGRNVVKGEIETYTTTGMFLRDVIDWADLSHPALR